MDSFNKLMQKKMKDAKPMSDLEKGAKVKAIHEMRKMATDEMSEPLKHLKKVTVASNDPEGIKMGLDKAKEMLGHQPEEEMPESSDEEEMSESPEEEHQEDMHPEMEASEHDEKSEEEMSPEELQAKIHELQMMLQEKSQHKF
jgi:ribosomal protein L29